LDDGGAGRPYTGTWTVARKPPALLSPRLISPPCECRGRSQGHARCRHGSEKLAKSEKRKVSRSVPPISSPAHLAARAPYFHNGSAATLLDAVNFYDQRFNIGFTDQQKEDLVNFLKTL
jgi:cytochrome c peroxidase